MTLPQNVKDAVKELDAVHDQRFAPWRGQWQTVRAHLLSQDAEIERLRSVHRWNIEKSGGNLMVCRDNHNKGEACEWEIFVPVGRAEKSESRLAAANALLRDIAGCQWFNREAPAIVELIDAHLQGAGDA